MLSLIYLTFRENCKFEYFIDSILRQSNSEINSKIQIIIVDGFLYNCDNPDKRS